MKPVKLIGLNGSLELPISPCLPRARPARELEVYLGKGEEGEEASMRHSHEVQ